MSARYHQEMSDKGLKRGGKEEGENKFPRENDVCDRNFDMISF